MYFWWNSCCWYSVFDRLLNVLMVRFIWLVFILFFRLMVLVCMVDRFMFGVILVQVLIRCGMKYILFILVMVIVKWCLLVCGVKFFCRLRVWVICCSVVVIGLVSCLVKGVGCIFCVVCMNSLLLKLCCNCVSVLDIVGCDSFSWWVIEEIWCFWKIF